LIISVALASNEMIRTTLPFTLLKQETIQVGDNVIVLSYHICLQREDVTREARAAKGEL
jgi:hypothetical protein